MHRHISIVFLCAWAKRCMLGLHTEKLNKKMEIEKMDDFFSLFSLNLLILMENVNVWREPNQHRLIRISLMLKIRRWKREEKAKQPSENMWIYQKRFFFLFTSKSKQRRRWMYVGECWISVFIYIVVDLKKSVFLPMITLTSIWLWHDIW